MDYTALKERIEKKIRQKGVLKMKMFEDLDLSRQTYHNMFDRKSINLNTLEKISEYLDTSIPELLGGSEKENVEWKEKYFKAVELLALNGIKLDLGKIKGGLYLRPSGHNFFYPIVPDGNPSLEMQAHFTSVTH
ncbi:helix-turn-helix domain-containing protein [Emticicia sp. BO119]|uniref:helix-turn-helix domain-containing protein n=1 Tax=Emticicia sp. BO119 TaxID=2757768 RepID=UPI0015F000DE|nr:helix-turn-helix domain-containing protein [Emticicia sp. BO119]MBA4848983.1 helix-turn-helix transcriptional regulator [Emticicia sp. BO119]